MKVPVANPIIRTLEDGDSSQCGLHKTRTMESSFLVCSNFRDLSRSAPSPVAAIACRPSASLKKSSLADIRQPGLLSWRKGKVFPLNRVTAWLGVCAQEIKLESRDTDPFPALT